VDIATRLRELRKARDLSQGDIRRRTGLECSYVSRVENGHTMPSIPLLERWAKALDVELYQLFFYGHDRPQTPVLPERTPVGAQERTLLRLFNEIPVEDRALVIALARDLAKRNGERG
jgi:transcriptional regulator with XRE-family HTH domain